MKHHLISGIILFLSALPVLSQNQTPHLLFDQEGGGGDTELLYPTDLGVKLFRGQGCFSVQFPRPNMACILKITRTNVSLIRQNDLYKNKKAGKNN